jgi:hypothetical protein
LYNQFATLVTEWEKALAERDAMQHEPARRWTFLTHPFFVALANTGVGEWVTIPKLIIYFDPNNLL